MARYLVVEKTETLPQVAVALQYSCRAHGGCDYCPRCGRYSFCARCQNCHLCNPGRVVDTSAKVLVAELPPQPKPQPTPLGFWRQAVAVSRRFDLSEFLPIAYLLGTVAYALYRGGLFGDGGAVALGHAFCIGLFTTVFLVYLAGAWEEGSVGWVAGLSLLQLWFTSAAWAGPIQEFKRGKIDEIMAEAGWIALIQVVSVNVILLLSGILRKR